MSGRDDAPPPRGPPGGGDPDPCASLSFTTNLLSPQEDAVEGLAVGDELQVVLDDGPPITVQVHDNGNLVGTIGSHLAQLIDCLQQGRDFKAGVLTVNGGQVQVQVQVQPS